MSVLSLVISLSRPPSPTHGHGPTTAADHDELRKNEGSAAAEDEGSKEGKKGGTKGKASRIEECYITAREREHRHRKLVSALGKTDNTECGAWSVPWKNH